MKRAIVLGGGGSKGAYHIGVWSALRELGITYDIVTGTSIGAMIGALMVQQDYEKAKDLWDHMSVDQVMEGGINLDISIDSFIEQKDDILPFIKNYINEKGANITPLKEMMTRLANFPQFYESSIDYGLVTTLYPSLKKVELTKNELPESLLIDYIIASGSCFPAFPIQKIEDKSYIDGGYSDNVPIHLAFKMGADEIIAIDLNRGIKHPLAYHNPTITYIHSYHDLGTMLDFSETILKRNQLLGYYDTLKAFHHYFGYYYTFNKDIQPQFRKTLNLVEAYLDDYLSFNPQSYLEIFQEYIKKPYLTEFDFDIITLEILAQYIHLDPLKVYDASYMNTIFLDYFKDASLFHYNTLLKNLSSPKALLDLYKEYEQSYIIGCIYHELRISKDFYKELNRFETLSTKMTLCALYLLSIDSEFIFPKA